MIFCVKSHLFLNKRNPECVCVNIGKYKVGKKKTGKSPRELLEFLNHLIGTLF